MDSKDFIKLLANPKEVEKLPVDELKKLSMEYPYSQPVQLLYAIRLSQSSEHLFNRQLGKTSILTDDRTVLFDLFERDVEETGTTTVLSPVVEEQPAATEVSAPEPKEEAINPAPPEEKGVEETAPVVSKEPAEPVKADHAPVEEKIPEEEKKVIPPVEKEPEKKPLDLSGLSPKEKVQAILEENRRIRQQFDTKKSGEPQAEVPEKPEGVITSKESPEMELPKPVEKEVSKEVIEPTPQVEEAQNSSDKPEEEVLPSGQAVDSGAELPEAAASEFKIEEPAEPLKSEPAPKEEPETPEEEKELVFTIDEDRPEPIFEIESDEEDDKSEVAKDVVADQPKENSKKEEHQEPVVSPGGEKSEAHSFAEWLHILQSSRAAEPAAETSKEENRGKQEEPVLPVKKKIELLDSFVEKLPELKRKNITAPRIDKPEINMGNLMGGEEDSLVTETLARVYMRQKHYEKAIKAYEIMKLKYPEKSSFFADQISEIRKLINSK